MAHQENFDAFYIWLGIPPEDRPATYYRLLDVKVFESDSEIIDIGYQRRIAYLKTIKPGDRSTRLEKLKSELADARHFLLNLADKQEYDAILRQRFASKGDAPSSNSGVVSARPIDVEPSRTGRFDPYIVWLGISPAEQPAHHYRLLDVRLFESEAAIIDDGFNRRMAYLRSIKDGEYLELAERIKDELTTARLCLMSPGKRSSYDASLRARTAVAATVSQVPAAQKTFSVAAAQGRRVPLLRAGLAACLLLLLCGIWYAVSNRGEQFVAREELNEDPPMVSLRPPRVSPAPVLVPMSSAVPRPTPAPTPAPTPVAANSASSSPAPPNTPTMKTATINATPTGVVPPVLEVVRSVTSTSAPIALPPIATASATGSPIRPNREFALEFNGIRNSKLTTIVPTLTHNGFAPLTLEFWYSHSDRLKGRPLDSLICGFVYSEDRTHPYFALRVAKAASDPSLSLVSIESFKLDVSISNQTTRRFANSKESPAISIAIGQSLPHRHHIALVAKRLEGSLLVTAYVDGKEAEDGLYDIADAPSNFVIGGPGFTGVIDEIRVSRSIRYRTDFTPRERFEPDAETTALYHLDEGSGTRLVDSSGNGHHVRMLPAIMRWIPVQSDVPATSIPLR